MDLTDLDTTPRDELERLADALLASGDLDSAMVVMDYVDRRSSAEDRAEALLDLSDPADAAGEPERDDVLPCPIAGVSADAWGRFLEAMIVGELDSVTPSGRLGLFGLSPRRLTDLGWVTNVRQEMTEEGPPRVVGDFVEPRTQASFLADAAEQYDAFSASIEAYAAEIQGKHRDAIGREIEGQTATLSGLLAVASFAGPELDSWLGSDEDRKDHKRTTASYQRANGLF